MRILTISRLTFLCILSQTIRGSVPEEDDQDYLHDEGVNLLIDDDGPVTPQKDVQENKCLLNVDPVNYFKTMKGIEDKYASDILAFEKAIQPKKMDSKMLNAIVNARGISDQAIEENYGRINQIPAGLDLGGYCILRQKESILFFHRMKLRNTTNFKILFFQNDIKNLVLRAKIALNDLNVHGTYERLMSDRIPTNLFYSPTFGRADVSLKDVQYKMEARYRMLSDRVIIEMVVSTLRLTEAYMVTQDVDSRTRSNPIILNAYLIEDFLERIKTDLDSWIKDSFNDKLIHISLGDDDTNERFAQYETEKTAAVNNYMQFLISLLHDKILDLNMDAVALPDFSIFSVGGKIFRIRNGVIRGLDTLFQRSVASAYRDGHNGTLRLLCGQVGFSNLLVSYQYEAVLAPGTPALHGLLVLSARELTALFSAAIMINPNSAEFIFQGLKQLGPEALTIEGPANKILGKLRHVIQNHILALMTYSLNFHVRNLRTITDCEPNIVPYHEPVTENEENKKEEHEKEHEKEHEIEDERDRVLRKRQKGKRRHKRENSPPSDKFNSKMDNGLMNKVKEVWRVKSRFNKTNGKKESSATEGVRTDTENMFKSKEERKRYYLLSGL